MANWLIHECFNKDGSVKPIFDIEDNKFLAQIKNGQQHQELSPKMRLVYLILFNYKKKNL